MRYGVREISDVVLKEIATGKPVLYLETLKVSSTEVKADTVYARGGAGNPKRLSWDSNKEVTYDMQDCLISPEGLAILAGTAAKSGVVTSHKKEYITVGGKKTALTVVPCTTAGTVKLTLNGVVHSIAVPVGTATVVGDAIAAAEIPGFSMTNAAGVITIIANNTFTYAFELGTAVGCTGTFDPASLPSDSALTAVLDKKPKAGEKLFIFTTTAGYDIGTEIPLITGYTISGNLVTIVSGVSDGAGIIADYYYNSSAKAKTIEINAEHFPGFYSLESTSLWRAEADGIDYPCLYTMPKIKLSTGFKIDNSSTGDPSIFDFKCEVYPDNNGKMVIIDILEN